MGYDAQIISPQLHKVSTKGLKIIANTWHDSPQMSWLIGREKAWRLRWPDNYDAANNPRRLQEQAALLNCWRTDAHSRCERANGCSGCPYAAGSPEQALPPWLPYQDEYEKQFYDVRCRLAFRFSIHLECWPNDGWFHAKSGEVISAENVTHYRLSFVPTPHHEPDQPSSLPSAHAEPALG